MEVIFGAKSPASSSQSDVTNVASFSREIRQGESSSAKNMQSKKRGVYVEKWANAKQPIEDNKRQPRSKVLSKQKEARMKPRIESTPKLLTSTPVESKISTYTRLLGTVDPAVRIIKRKSLKKTPVPIPITSKISAKTLKPVIKPPRNIIEENKKNVKKMKYRSNNLREVYAEKSKKTITFKPKKEVVHSPSDSSKLTREISDSAHWSKIFPTACKNNKNSGRSLLQQYICNHEQEEKTAPTDKVIDKKDTKATQKQGKEKQKPIYDFFIDLLESVYDDDNDAAPVEGSESSQVSLEIDDKVAEKLYADLDDVVKIQYTIKDDDFEFDQSRQLADYYNNKSRLIPKRNRRKKATIKKYFPYFDPTHAKLKKKPKTLKKPNLLNILKKQLSMDCDRQEEPSNMYEALLSIAKKNRKGRQIYIDTSSKEPSDLDKVCRFKRRNVILSRSRIPRDNNPTKEYMFNSFNSRPNYKNRSVASIIRDRESNHSLEVEGFDYDIYDDEFRNPGTDDTQYSDTEIVNRSARNITKLNEGITTVTQYWKN